MNAELPEHVRRNRAAWDSWAESYSKWAPRAWAQSEPTWGIWGLPERDLRVLPDVDGKDVIELGCGTAYWSAWMARRGARVVGIDNSEKQLETARALLNAVDQSLGSSIATREALATLSSLDRGGRTPAIALTAYGRAQDRMRSLAAGYNMHVPKPVDPGELTTIIASLAGTKVRADENGTASFSRRRAHLYKLVPGGGLPREVVVIGPYTYSNANVQAALAAYRIAKASGLAKR